MTTHAIGWLRRQYLCVLRNHLGLEAAALLAACASVGLVKAAPIVPDGRTATRISVNGPVTDITTATVRGATGFNSFSRFNIPGGDTVNLHLPGGTANLLNLVHGERSYLDGVMNAYKDGRIGGNVFFLNPHGIVVGKTGTLNAGTLTLAAPTPGFMNELIDPSGRIGEAAVQQTLAGHIPLTESGLVSVEGRIHAVDGVSIAAGTVDVSGRIDAGPRAQVAFGELVNVQGLESGAAVRTDGGTIRIVAVGDIGVSGTLAADGSGADSSGGRVEILAGRDATLTASGRVSADAGESGDGGFVEFSGKREVRLEGTGLSARSAVGRAGQILIDPENLTWSGAGNDFYSHGARITLSADNKIILDDVVISSRDLGAAQDTRDNHAQLASQGSSGDIELTAKEIEIKNGSQLLAHADGGYDAGKVTLTASDDQSTPFFGSVEDSTARIDIRDAVIQGGDVSIAATANDKWVWTGNEYADTVLEMLDSLRVGANVTFSSAQASVTVDQGAHIAAAGRLDITAAAIADASMKVMSTLAGFGYGDTDAQATVQVGRATLESTGAMTLGSHAESSLDVTVATVNTGLLSNPASKASQYANFALAVGIANQVAETTIGDEAKITRAGSLDVQASGKKAHSVNASGGSFKDGIASSGVSVLVSDTRLTARLGGQVSADRVTVKAELADASTEVSAAAGTAGSPDLREAITSARPVDDILFEKLSDFVARAPELDQRSGANSKLGLAAAFAWSDSNNDVTAEVTGGASIATPGGLSVRALAEEALSFETSAAVDQRDLDTQLPGDPNAPSDKKKIALSASVAVIDVTHHADALIGDGAVIDAGGPVEVLAQSLITPFWQQWLDLVARIGDMDWNSASAWLGLGSALYELLGDPVGATSWTQTGVESERLAFAGTVDFFRLDQQATARVGDAEINAGVETPAAEQDVTVSAQASHGILNLVGVPEFDPSSIGSGSSESGSAGFGGSYHQLDLTGGADVSIARGATVKADDLVVAADTGFDVITLAETVGKAGKVSINGAFSLVDTDVTTIA